MKEQTTNRETSVGGFSAHVHLQQGVTAGNTKNNTRSHRPIEIKNSKENLAFLKDAGMGLFIHWSLDAQLGCVISHSLVGASKAYCDRFYEELPKTLVPGEWDFAYMAHLARLAGFRYAVLTTKHHNGFCLWPTKTTEFHVMNTRIQRDLVKEYAQAFRQEGIKVGFYFSPEDFWFLRSQGQPITREPREPYPARVEEAYRAHLEAQMRELMEDFGKVDLLFFDGGETMILEDGRSLQDVCMEVAWQLQPEVLITRGAIPTPEQRVVGEAEVGEAVFSEDPWEACFTIGSAWQHQPTNEHYKTGREIIELLMDTRSKGGSFLLNIGPDERGRIVLEEEKVLRELALWHFINGECVHEVRPWTGRKDHGSYLVRSKQGDAVYAVVMDHEFRRGVREEVVLSSVSLGEDSDISVLGSTSEFVEYHPEIDCSIRAWQQEDGLHISLVRSQRIYCGSDFTDPLVLKITHPILVKK